MSQGRGLWIPLGFVGWLLVAVVVGFVVGSATHLGKLAIIELRVVAIRGTDQSLHTSLEDIATSRQYAGLGVTGVCTACTFATPPAFLTRATKLFALGCAG